MFDRCQAHLITQTDSQHSAMRRFAIKCGFPDPDLPAGGTGGRAKLHFFIMHYGLAVATSLEVVRSIRTCGDENVQLSPIVLVAEDCPIEQMFEYVRRGFDDVICLPEKPDIVIGRLQTLVTSDHLYIETSDYLGPDRRRFDLPGKGTRREGGKAYSKLTVRRDLALGSRVVSRQFIASNPTPTSRSAPSMAADRLGGQHR